MRDSPIGHRIDEIHAARYWSNQLNWRRSDWLTMDRFSADVQRCFETLRDALTGRQRATNRPFLRWLQLKEAFSFRDLEMGCSEMPKCTERTQLMAFQSVKYRSNDTLLSLWDVQRCPNQPQEGNLLHSSQLNVVKNDALLSLCDALECSGVLKDIQINRKRATYCTLIS